MSSVRLHVLGQPYPQGSIKMVPRKNGTGFAPTYPKQVWEWRAKVQQAVADAMMADDLEPFLGPVEVHLGFEFAHLLGHFGTGRNAGKLKPSAPKHPIVAPDLDKLVRGVCDAITDAGLWKDDAQVAFIRAGKRYVTTAPGVHITIAEVP